MAHTEEAQMEASAPDVEMKEESQAGGAEPEPAAVALEAMVDNGDKVPIEEPQREESQAGRTEPEPAAAAPEAKVDNGDKVLSEEPQGEEPQALAARLEPAVEDPEAKALAARPEPAVEDPEAKVDISDEAPSEEPKREEPQVAAAQPELAAETPEAKVRTSRARSGAKAPSLEVMAAKIKRLQEEAAEADAALAAEAKKLEELQAEVDAALAAEAKKVATMRSDAEAKHAKANRASQEYIRKQCEAAIAQLESCIPKRPVTGFFRFAAGHRVKGMDSVQQNTRMSEMWKNLADQERQKYTDQFNEEMKRFKEWGNSEEGKKNLHERNELIRECKATNKEELDKALDAMGSSKAEDVAEASPAKRSKGQVETPVKRPAKQRRVEPTKAAQPANKLLLDGKVLEEADEAGMLEQLRNLAGRPDVLTLGKSSQELWDALKANSGMVNAAKHALLSA